MRAHHVAIVALTTAAPALVFAALALSSDDQAPTAATPDGVTAGRSPPTATPPGQTTPSPSPPVTSPPDDPRPDTVTSGLLQFRGNPSHTWYGTGPVPDDPRVLWRYPDSAMCTREVTGTRPVASPSPGGPTTTPVTKLWCGTGWTGQPAVWKRPDGVTEVVVGAFDGAVHFLDAATGRPTRPRFQTGDMIKGSVTIDPDGYPLLYTGSRDGLFHVVALDRPTPTELWTLPAHPQRVWNNDWDGNASIVDGVLYVGGEDSWFYAVELNRDTGPNGLVTVAPEVLVETPGWTDDLFGRVGDRNVSIENSAVVVDDRAYFANSGGRVVGLDISRVRDGVAPVVFDYWVGDDVDGSIVVDAEGMLYVPVELERFLPRAGEVGQLVKLDPSRPDDPRVWGVAVPPRPPPGVARDDGGIWSTPALHDGTLYVTTHPGDLMAVDTATGTVTYREDIGYHEWSSPVVVDGMLVVATCEGGSLRAYDVSDPAVPQHRWTLALPGGACIESTPAVWEGRMFVGARDGFVYGIGG